MIDIFDRYAPFIQDYIYENGWENLRAVQTAAGDAIFNSDENVLITASTASGKTEAAFFPIVTLLSEDPPTSVGVIYIAPMKALINDQYDRITEIASRCDIPVTRWHGDVSQSKKKKLTEHPAGILQITPESLEAILLRRHSLVNKLFGDVRFIVIDELHSLMRGDRGGQTLCLLERLAGITGVYPRRIGLSATIGDPVKAGKFLAAGSGRKTIIPNIPNIPQKWRISVEHFFTRGPEAGDAVDENNKPLPELSAPTDKAPASADPGMAYIFEHTRGKKCLVFCNSREESETVTSTLRQYCEANDEPDRFMIHHGNLSTSIRESAEEAMKDEDTAITTVTTATLELGIDIGRLERAFQIDAPFTVSSFLQRMGRTGRRNLPPEMWFVIREDPVLPRAMMPESVPWKLIQAIALVQIYLEEKWVEPPRLDRLPYSLLYHQTMSTLASLGEMTPAELAGHVLPLSVFYRISTDDYKVLLRHLIDIDHIEQTERGGLIAGLAGERVINDYKFYAVFAENEEYTVRSESEEIGTLCAPPPPGDKIAIGGHVWVVEDVDRKRHLVYCTMVKGIVPAYFGDVPGDLNTKIVKRMKRVLEEDNMYPYLMKNAVGRLNIARGQAREAHLTENPLINLGGNMWALFPWLGTYSVLALERFLKIKCANRLGLKGLSPARPYYMQFTMKASKEEFFRIVKEEAAKKFDPLELVYPKEVPDFEKYDEFVPDELVRKGFAYGVLNTAEMLETVLKWQ